VSPGAEALSASLPGLPEDWIKARARRLNARRSRVFSSNGESADVTVVSEDTSGKYVVKGSLATAKGAKTMALDASTHRIYVPALGASGVEILVAASK
jgi:hypothetical protein